MEVRVYRVLAHPLVRYGVGVLVGVFLLVFSALFIPALVRLAGPPPDFWALGYDARRLAGYLGALGQEGQRLYALFLEADVLFALLYGPWLTGWLYYAYRSPAYARWPLIAALADIGEDLLVLAFMKHPGGALATLAAYLTFLKWLLLAYTLFALVFGWLMRPRRL